MSLPIHTPEVLEYLLQKAEAVKAAHEAIAAYIG